jgi:ABC-type Fe3+-hydroxamate transport system substrate-binding protein
VVSLSAQATRIVVALGQAGRLVAVDAASAALPGLEALPRAELASLRRLAPDVVLAPRAEAEAARRALPRAEVVEVDVHDFDDGWALCHAIGAALGREEEARRFVWERSRPLAEISAASFAARRPRVAGVLGLAPLEVAGGHSFATDLIEMAGGESVTHGSEAIRLAWTPAQLAAAAPELVVLFGPGLGAEDPRGALRRRIGPGPRIEQLPLELERVWLSQGPRAAGRMRGWIEEISAGEGSPPHPAGDPSGGSTSP